MYTILYFTSQYESCVVVNVLIVNLQIDTHDDDMSIWYEHHNVYNLLE